MKIILIFFINLKRVWLEELYLYRYSSSYPPFSSFKPQS